MLWRVAVIRTDVLEECIISNHQGNKNQCARNNISSQIYWGSGLCPSSGIKILEHDISETGSTLLGPLERANNLKQFLHSMLWLLVTANISITPILVTLMMEAVLSSETSMFTKAAWCYHLRRWHSSVCSFSLPLVSVTLVWIVLQVSSMRHHLLLTLPVLMTAMWSTGQSSQLQRQRFQVRFTALPDFLWSSGSETGST
jgi:hypothetical protein